MTRALAALGGGILGLWLTGSVAAQAGEPAPATSQPAPAASSQPPSAAAATDAAPAAQPPSAAAVEAPPAQPPSAAAAEAPPPAPPPPPSAASPSPPDGNPYVPAHGTYHRWTAEDVARVRAMLAEQRTRQARRGAEPERPRVYGDARAPFMIGLDVDVLFRHDVGFRYFDGGETSLRLGAFASYDVLELAPSVHLGVELGAGFEHDTAPGLLGSGVKADLDSQTVHGGVSVRWDALSVLSPFARATGGASFFQLSFGDNTPALDTSHATSGFGTLGAGVLLHTPPRAFENRNGDLASFGLGVLIEGGYALRSPADFALHTTSDPHAITVVDASLGRLTLSAPYLRLSFLIRF